MIFKNSDYAALAEKIKRDRKSIIIYGAGMVGQIVVPYLAEKYDLYEYIDCFIDMDKRKAGQLVKMGNYSYAIKSPDYLQRLTGDFLMLITNSKFFPIVSFLNGIEELKDVEGYIVPIMQICALEKIKPEGVPRRTEKRLIPKKIHYCWFGKNPLSDFLENCIKSWKEICPDYEIIQWNEENYDVNKHRYTREAYEQGKYGFVSDVARLDILYENGGIYFDTDVTILKDPEDLLYQQGFIGVEKWGNINTGGGCGFIKGHPMLKKMLDYREQFPFVLNDGTLNTETNGIYETRPFLDAGFKPDNSLQTVEGVTVYPSYIFHPYDYMSGSLCKNPATVSIHHFTGGWMDENDRRNKEKTQEEYAAFLNMIRA